MNFTKSQCPYCGVGCGLKIKPKSSVSDDKWLVSGDRDSPSTQGKLCVKGATVCETLKAVSYTHLTLPTTGSV